MRLDRRKAHNIDQLFTVDGDPADASGPVAVVVTRDDGTELDSIASAERISEGVYRYALAPQAQLDRLTFTYTGTWSGTEQTDERAHDLVGGHYFTETEARALPGTSAFTDDQIRLVRDEVEDAIESYVARALPKGVAFVPRYRRVVANGTATESIELPDYFVQSILSATEDGVALTGPQLLDLVAASGQLTSTLLVWTRGLRNVVLAYEHGKDSPPTIIRRASLLLFKEWLPVLTAANSGPTLADLRSLSAEGLSLGFGSASRGGDTTGITAVDRLLDSWLATPSFASAPVT